MSFVSAVLGITIGTLALKFLKYFKEMFKFWFSLVGVVQAVQLNFVIS